MFDKQPKHFNKAVLAICCFGFLLRAIEFFLNRSLWCDEALLACNFLDRDFAGLLKPLQNNQAAPVAFLWIEKAIFMSFGKTDFALHIFPFIISIVCLLLFVRLATRVIGKNFAALVVMFLFATTIFLLRYTLEVKQYQGDMLVTLYFGNRLLTCIDYRRKRFLAEMCLAGIVAVWFSNIAVIVLFSAGVYILHQQFLKTKKISFAWLPVFAAWIISFAVYFYYFIYNHPTEAVMLQFWQQNFPPANIFSTAFVLWLANAYQMIVFALIPFVSIYNPLFYLYIIFAVAGTVEMYRSGKKILILCLLPVCLHLLLAFLHKYPVADKFLLYLFPWLYILLGAGLLYISRMVKGKAFLQSLFFYAVSGCIIFLALLDLYIQYPFRLQEIKESIVFAEKNCPPGQSVFINDGAKEAFRFYKETGYVQANTSFIISERYLEAAPYAASFANKQQGFGLLFSHMNSGIEAAVIKNLQTKYKLVKTFKTAGSSCYFFALQ